MVTLVVFLFGVDLLIDQKERNEHINMARIYRNAENICIWLGNYASDLEFSFVACYPEAWQPASAHYVYGQEVADFISCIYAPGKADPLWYCRTKKLINSPTSQSWDSKGSDKGRV